MRVRALHLDPLNYQRHALHAEDRVWVEKNCYFDVWIELIHALGCDPYAIIPVVAALDFEGDQWTFYKPPLNELRELYGIEVNEMTAWRPMLEHAQEHLGAGKMIAVEADAWWLPDVAGTDYRQNHVKSTIVLVDVDAPARRLGYFHNASYYELEGEDFDRTFQLAGVAPDFLPFFAELVRVDRVVRRPPQELAAIARGLLQRHLSRRPRDNPIERFAARFQADLPALQARGLEHYHMWAFATLRQLGSACELLALHLRWQAAHGAGLADDAGALAPAVEAFETISAGAKSFILKAARAVNTGRPLESMPIFEQWASAWQRAMSTLEENA
ncbi:DUF1839 family protein [Dyella sp.]|jgi:hypothetical protein|uniref:DUF1839 family protein n=1 Tax=Dyella sp. TaxID=1869338 RepID=UPI002D78003D|nr:DUF1839 family protein [Dyella sp.]HET6431955.1 DUF1839 family protein [Dyella sp.]